MATFTLSYGDFHKNKATVNLITVALPINILKCIKINQLILRRFCDTLLFILLLHISRILHCHIWGIRATGQGSGLCLPIHHAALRHRICPHRRELKQEVLVKLRYETPHFGYFAIVYVVTKLLDIPYLQG